MVIFHSYSIVMGQFTRGYFHEITNKSPLNPIKSLNEATFSIIFHSCLYVYHINHNFSWENHHVQRENHHFFVCLPEGHRPLSYSSPIETEALSREAELQHAAQRSEKTLEQKFRDVQRRMTCGGDTLWLCQQLAIENGYGNSGFSH